MASTTVPIAGLEQRLVQLAGAAVKFKVPIKVISRMVLSDIKSNFAGGHSPDGVRWKPLAHGRPSGGSALPLRDNGLLLASLTTRESPTEIAVGTNLAYAGVHQWGGIIRPVRAKLLAIPITKEAKRAGGPRNFPRPLTAIIGKSGEGVLLETPPRRPKPAKPKRSTAVTNGSVKKPAVPTPGERGKVQFVLVKEVVVPARPFLGLSAGLLDRVERLLIDEAARAINGQ
jgi:phage gpG-like protein